MTRTRHSVCAAAVAVGLLLSTPGLGAAEPAPAAPNDIATLIAAVANANQQLQDIGASVQSRQEAVNKAIVDVQTARDQAEAAKAEVAASQRGVEDANAAIAAAQQRFDTYAATAYINGPSASYLTSTTPEDFIATASAGETLAISAKQTLNDLLRARTEQVNRESAARAAQQRGGPGGGRRPAQPGRGGHGADRCATGIRRPEGPGRPPGRRARRRQGASWTAARAQWSTSSATVPPAAAPKPAAPAAPADRWDVPGANAPAAQPNPSNWDTSVWDPILPAIPSAFVSGDPIAIINAVLGITATSSQVTADLGRNFLIKMGIIKPTQPDTGHHQRAHPAGVRLAGGRSTSSAGACPRSASRTRGAAEPPAGPASAQGDDTVGFDCSGLVLYSFAGVGIKLPHYSGAQYDMGRKIPAAQMQRGDVIFYGPGRQPARDHLPRQRPDARGPAERGAGQGLAGAHQRHDAVRRALHRTLTGGSVLASDSSAADCLHGLGAAADRVRGTGGG